MISRIKRKCAAQWVTSLLYINEWAGTFLVLAAFDTLYSKAAPQFVCGSADPFPRGFVQCPSFCFLYYRPNIVIMGQIISRLHLTSFACLFHSESLWRQQIWIDFISPTIKWPKACLQRISSRNGCTVSNHETCSPNLGFFNRLHVCQTIYLVV